MKGKLTRRQFCILTAVAVGTEIAWFCPPSQSYQIYFTRNFCLMITPMHALSYGKPEKNIYKSSHLNNFIRQSVWVPTTTAIAISTSTVTLTITPTPIQLTV
jgi:hypothetical protein